MAHMIFFLCSLLFLSITQRIHAVNYTVINRAANTPGGASFNRVIGVQYSKQTLWIQNLSGNIKRAFQGVSYHESTHVWQWNGNGRAPGGLIEGIADYVRPKAGLAPSHRVKPGQENRWDQGYDVTARFLDYCNSLKNGFVAQLNKKMRNGYSNQYLVDLLGKSVDQLWKDYKDKFPAWHYVA